MKVSLADNGLIIEPETDFEEAYLQKIEINRVSLFHKTSLTPADYVGIKIVIPDTRIDDSIGR